MDLGIKWWLLYLLVVRSLTHSCRAFSTAPKQVQLPGLDPAKQFAADFRMQATSYAAHMIVRDYQTSDSSHCNYPGLAADVCRWSAQDPGWERLVRAESMVAIAHQAFRAAEYDEAIIALEESLALRLFAYTDQKTLDRWQQGLVMPGSQYRHDKRTIADSLVLRSDCLVQLARANHDVAELTEATELLQLAAAELQAGQALTSDSMAAISSRMSSIAALAADLLPRLSLSRLQELLEQHGISCSPSSSNATSVDVEQPPEWCDSAGELLLHLVPLLRLPVCLTGPKGRMLSSSLGCSSSIQQPGQQQQQQPPQLRKGQVPSVKPVSDPFASFGTALLQKPCEVVAQYLQRMFFRLLSVVPVEYMRDLQVPCQRTDSRSRCISYLPSWVTAQAVTIDKRTGRAHVTRPSSACAADSSDSSGSSAVCGAASSQQQHGGLELCGFLQIRSRYPSTQASAAGGHAQDIPRSEAGSGAPARRGGSGASSCPAGNSASCSGRVFYYYFPDIPSVLDHVMLTQEYEESMYLLSQLDSLMQTHSLKRWLTRRHKASDCTEAALLEGRAPQTCSVLVPSIGDCAAHSLTAAAVGAGSASALPITLSPPSASHSSKQRERASAGQAAAGASSQAGAGPCAGAAAASAAAAAAAASSRQGSGSAAGKCGSDSSREAGVSNKRGHQWQRDTYDVDDDDEDDELMTSSSGSSRRNSNGSKRRRSKQSTDPYLEPPPYPHMFNSFARVDREIADRQLLEQMNKLERDKRHKQQDGPLIPFTLGLLGCLAASLMISRRWRGSSSSSRQQLQQQQQPPPGVLGYLAPWWLWRPRKAAAAPWKLPAAAAVAPGGSVGPGAPGNYSTSSNNVAALHTEAGSAVGGACESGAGGGGTAAADAASYAHSSYQQRQAAAAVKAALSCNDMEVMDGALRQAEAAGMSSTGNCVRLRELYNKRRKQAQQAKRQEQMRLQEQARRVKKEKERGRKGGQDQACVGSQQQAATADVKLSPKQSKFGGKQPSAGPAWVQKLLFWKRGKQASNTSSINSSSSSADTGAVELPAAASSGDLTATGAISRSCSISSSRSASSSILSSTASAAGSPLQSPADNSSSSSSGCSPSPSASCSPQGFFVGTTAAAHSQDTNSQPPAVATTTASPSQQQKDRTSSSRRAGRGSVTVAVAARGSAAAAQQQQRQQQQQGTAQSPGAAHATRAKAQQQQPQQPDTTECGVVSPLDIPSPTAAGARPTPSPSRRSRGSAAAAQQPSAGSTPTGATARKDKKNQQQATTVSLSAAAYACDSELCRSPAAVITASGVSGTAQSALGVAAGGNGSVEPPATPAGAPVMSPLRADRLAGQQQQQQLLPPPWQHSHQPPQRQQSGRMSWLEAACPTKQRAAAASEDGTNSNSSSCMNSPGARGPTAATAAGSSDAAAGTPTYSTPTKVQNKLNPKAAPYNPKGFAVSPGSATAGTPPHAAAAAAGTVWHSPAGTAPGLILTPSPPDVLATTGSSSWQQQQQAAAAARGAAGLGGMAGVAHMLQQQEAAQFMNRMGHGSSSVPEGLTGLGGAPPPGQLVGGLSSAGFQGHHMQHVLLQQQQQQQAAAGSAGAMYGQMMQPSAAAAATWEQHQQQAQREEQLMAMLSALSPEEAAAAAAMRIRGAGGSAPQALGTAGSSGSSGVTAARMRGDSSSNTSSASGEYRGHLLPAADWRGLGAAGGQGGADPSAGGPVGVGGSGRPPLGPPPGLSGALSWQHQQQQQQFLRAVSRPGRITLPQDLDSQLPPGFSAETFPHADHTPGSISGHNSSTSSTTAAPAGPGAFTQSAAPTPGSLTSPGSGLGMQASTAAMLAASSNPWSYCPAQGKPATPLLIVSEAATSCPIGMQGYGHSTQSLDMDTQMAAAAAATSANVAELVLGSSPPALKGVEEMFYRQDRMTAADADAHAARLADEMTAGVLLD